MENNINTQQPFSLNQPTDQEINLQSQDKKVSKLLILVLVVTWLLYIPSAFVIFGLSAMAGDGGHISFMVGLMVLLINLALLIIIIATTFFALRKKSLLLALLPFFMFIGIQILATALSSVSNQLAAAPKNYITFGKNIPSKPTLFVCPQDSVLSFNSVVVSEVTGNVTRYGWKDTGGGRYVGEIKYSSLVLRDEKDRSKIETCKNPNGESIASIILLNQPTSLTDISFDAVVPRQSSYFVCPSEKVLELRKNDIDDITRFVTKNGWQAKIRGSYLGMISVNEGLIASTEMGRLAMETCKNPEGKTIAEVVGQTPKLSQWSSDR